MTGVLGRLFRFGRAPPATTGLPPTGMDRDGGSAGAPAVASASGSNDNAPPPPPVPAAASASTSGSASAASTPSKPSKRQQKKQRKAAAAAAATTTTTTSIVVPSTTDDIQAKLEAITQSVAPIPAPLGAPVDATEPTATAAEPDGIAAMITGPASAGFSLGAPVVPALQKGQFSAFQPLLPTHGVGAIQKLNWLEDALLIWDASLAERQRSVDTILPRARLALDGSNFAAVFHHFLPYTSNAVLTALQIARTTKHMNKATAIQLVLGQVDFSSKLCLATSLSGAFSSLVKDQILANRREGRMHNSKSNMADDFLYCALVRTRTAAQMGKSCGCSFGSATALAKSSFSSGGDAILTPAPDTDEKQRFY